MRSDLFCKSATLPQIS